MDENDSKPQQPMCNKSNDDKEMKTILTEKIKSIFWDIFAIILTLLVILGIFYLVKSFTTNNQPRTKTCTVDSIQNCQTKEVCEKNNMFWWDNSCHINKPESQSSEFLDYDSLIHLKSLPIVENFVSWTPNNKPENDKTYNGLILTKGQLAKGYVEFILSVGEKPFTTWESIYFKALPFTTYHYLYGAHILRAYSLKVPASDKTHLLYSLNNIPFTTQIPYSDSNKITGRLDLFDLINTKKRVDFMTFISSLTPAKIDLIKIYYECDPMVDNGKCELTTKQN
jgi:hypothetical protein